VTDFYTVISHVIELLRSRECVSYRALKLQLQIDDETPEGDGLLVYFGFPAAHEDDARRAVHTGLGIVEAIAGLNTSLAVQYGVQLAVRLGIHTGLVVVGVMGGGGRHEHLALGETPNLAARLQAPAAATLAGVCMRSARVQSTPCSWSLIISTARGRLVCTSVSTMGCQPGSAPSRSHALPHAFQQGISRPGIASAGRQQQRARRGREDGVVEGGFDAQRDSHGQRKEP
jgi:Adenylate and Guanylate cyclase catalytic domain